MKPKLAIWIALFFFLVLGFGANVLFTQLYHSRSMDRLDRCVANASETGRDSSMCYQATSAADSAYSSSSSVNQLILFMAFMAIILVADRLFANERRIDDLEKRLNNRMQEGNDV